MPTDEDSMDMDDPLNRHIKPLQFKEFDAFSARFANLNGMDIFNVVAMQEGTQ